MRAATAVKTITPVQGMQMAGFDRRSLPAEDTLDDLQVCALALLDDRDGAFVFCVYDSLGTDSTFCAGVKQAVGTLCGLAPQQVWVGATHTHAAPGAHFYGKKGYDAAFAQQMIQAGAETAAQALERARCAPKAAAYAAVPTVTGVTSLRNRGREGADFAMPLPFVRLETGDGTLTLARMACHPTVLDEKNLRYSADLAGALRRKLGENALVLNGACGDLSTRFTRNASTPQELERISALAAAAVETAQPQPVPGFGARIAAAELLVELPCAADFAPEQRQQLLTEIRQKLAACTDTQAAREYDSRLAVLERPPVQREKSRAVRVCAVDLGPCVLTGLPFEIDFADAVAMENTLAAAAGKPVFAVCYTGGCESYLPSGAPLTADSSYEDIASVYLPESRRLLLEAALECVRRCAKTV